MSVFHVKYPRMKHEENSIRGVREAKRRGHDEIDLDLSISLADPRCPLRHPLGEPCKGHIYGNHWPRPMERDGFRDTALRNRMPKDKVFSTMTVKQVGRLVARTGRRLFRIRRIERLLQECAKRGVGAVLEPKDDDRFDEDWPWEHIAQVADDCGVEVRVYGFHPKALAAAKRHGLKVRRLAK